MECLAYHLVQSLLGSMLEEFDAEESLLDWRRNGFEDQRQRGLVGRGVGVMDKQLPGQLAVATVDISFYRIGKLTVSK